jgi:AAA family ATP:ADP antiporter
MSGSPSRSGGPLDRALRLFGDVRRGEGARLALLAANLFLLLLAYYLLKTVREPLILGDDGGGAEVKSYASALQAVILVGVSLAFGWLATRLSRIALLTTVTGFFAVNLALFVGLFVLAPKWHLGLGIAFFIWVGCFSVMVIAQFWAFANDLYRKDQGERLFGIIAGGSAVGAFAGAKIAKPLFKLVGPFGMMAIAALVLVGSLAITWLVHRGASVDAEGKEHEGKPLRPGDGFSLMLRDRYLLLVGALSFLKNWINTTGEYILDRRLVEAAAQRFADTGAREAFIAGFKSDYFSWVNGLVMVMQFFAVSRLVQYLGVRRALLILPAIALCSYSAMAFVPVLGIVLAGKIAENTADYSVQKTAEQTLFLVTTREAKYKVKAIVDTVLVRCGDVLSAATVWVGVRLGLGTLGFIFANLALIVLYTGVVVALGRAHARKDHPTKKEREPSSSRSPAPRLRSATAAAG